VDKVRFLFPVQLCKVRTMSPYPFHRGFTLIELLVVIAIIGLLASIVLASLGSANVKARDAKRASEMHSLQNALELYYVANGQYPASPLNTQVINLNVPPNSDITPYINPIPTDPTRTGWSGYRYIQSNINGRQSYTMLVWLEKNTTWCSVGMLPGYYPWNQTGYTDVITSNYPKCQF